MPWRQEEQARVHCCSTGKSMVLRIAGYVLMAADAVLILLCVPVWAWLAAIGGALIFSGVLIERN